MKILLLEDDDNLNRGITLKLTKEGYEVLSASGVAQAEALLSENEVSLIISDITMQDGNGMEFCRGVREHSDVHIIFLTALDTELDIVNGYDAGADDYITKPFSLMVLISKVNALMRRIDHSPDSGSVMSSGDITVNCQEMRVYRSEKEIPLSKKEMQLLVYLWEHAGQILSKESILEHVWDIDGQFVDDNTVTVNISRLKNKLGTEEISNVRGLGYIWTGKVTRR